MRKWLSMRLLNLWAWEIRKRLQGNDLAIGIFEVKTIDYKYMIESGGTFGDVMRHCDKQREEELADMRETLRKLQE